MLANNYVEPQLIYTVEPQPKISRLILHTPIIIIMNKYNHIQFVTPHPVYVSKSSSTDSGKWQNV